MSQDFTAFIEKITSDPALEENLNKLISEGSLEGIRAFAKEEGFTISAEDIAALRESETELSDDDLEVVSGGLDLSPGDKLRALEKKIANDITRIEERWGKIH